MEWAYSHWMRGRVCFTEAYLTMLSIDSYIGQ